MTSLEIRQKNNLRTGVKLAAEIESTSFDLRRFIVIVGYTYNDNIYKSLDQIINSNSDNEIYFEVRCYEIKKEFCKEEYDIVDDMLINDIIISDIKGFHLLEEELKKYIKDFSILQPSWNCDNPI